MKSYCFLIGAFIFLFTAGKAQDPPAGAQAEANLRALAGSAGNVPVKTFNSAYEGIRGTPYLFENWKTGNIKLTSGKAVTGVQIKLDTYANNLVYKDPSTSDSIILNTRLISSFSFDEETLPGKFIKIPVDQNSIFELKFARIIYDGNIKLYHYPYKKLIKADYTGAYSANRPYDELVNDESFYLQRSNGNLEKMRTSKRSVLKTFDDKRADLNSFMKQQNITGRSVEELIDIVRFYDLLD